ncbi:DNA methyltransferase [Sphingomonas sp.]|uniref:site-specific DNA-methyltransferase n=1 Tax=Sphingomonas sp. TaxID=28214 RepID=UPI0018266BFA|nr:DNA methyltransferase [Sphingomonas sp.]MBA3511587.1 ParB N-terminal domain-containing protein [Sphingomonas sp.]
MFAPSKIQKLAIAELEPRPQNARTHSPKQIRKIAESLRHFGFVNPVLIDERRCIIAGHGRVEAAKVLGLSTVPTITLTHLSKAEVRAYVLADNQLATLAGWDRELLAIEIATLAETVPELDLTITGFDAEEIELLCDLKEGDDNEEVILPRAIASEHQPSVTRPGDLWRIGRHRLLCGNALDPNSYRELLGAERADMVITDPPYNVPIVGHVSGLGVVQHREFSMASGEMTRTEFRRFLSDACSLLARFSRSGSLHFIFMDWRSIADLVAAGEQNYDELLNIIVWMKNNAGMGSLYRSRHELVALFKKGRRSHVNNVELGKHGRYRTNVWEYPGANSFGTDRSTDLALHPTVKNVRMIADAIKDVTDPGAIVLDPFAGSGTTLAAAERSRRTSRLMELDPLYCDIIVRRGCSIGLHAELEGEGTPFEEVGRARTGDFAGLCKLEQEPAS